MCGVVSEGSVVVVNCHTVMIELNIERFYRLPAARVFSLSSNVTGGIDAELGSIKRLGGGDVVGMDCVVVLPSARLLRTREQRGIRIKNTNALWTTSLDSSNRSGIIADANSLTVRSIRYVHNRPINRASQTEV